MNVEILKADREQLLAFREEGSGLRWKIDQAVNKSKHEGSLRDHRYRDTWNITHPKTGKPFGANANWFKSFGTDEQKEMIQDRHREIEQSICAEERQREEEIDQEIKKIYAKYEHIWKRGGWSGGWPSEYGGYDGESDLPDLLLFAQRILEVNKT